MKRLYQVIDIRAEVTVGAIYTDPNPVAITRQLEEMVNDSKSDFAKHPADYALLELGVQHEGSWEIEPRDGGPAVLLNLSELKQKQ